MKPSDEREQLERVRQRFTRSADHFTKFALATRKEEAGRLVRLADAQASDVVLDVACGPGTFAIGFAPHVRSVHGIDLTPAILAKAQQAVRAESLENVALVCGTASALPYRNATFDLAACGYSLHHMTHPAEALRELARVLRPRGRVALVDLIVPEGANPAKHNEIERLRDSSHATTLTAGQLRALLETAGFEIRAGEQTERVRSFRDWMRIAGCKPGDPAWASTRQLMEASAASDSAGYRPRPLTVASGAESPDIEFVQTSLFIAGVKS